MVGGFLLFRFLLGHLDRTVMTRIGPFVDPNTLTGGNPNDTVIFE